MDIYIGIYDEDAIYARRLMAGILTKSENKCQTVEFTKPEKINVFSENHILELVLISQTAYTPDIKSDRVGRIVVLCEEKPDKELLAWAEEQKVSILFKYQPITILVREILSGRYSNDEITEKKTIAIYSPVHRCGKTLFSLALAQILSEKKPVLYISMDEYSPIPAVSGIEKKNDVMDVMYYYLQGGLEAREKQMICSWGNIDLLMPAGSADDIRGISADEFYGMVEHFLKKSIYSCIVVDIGDLSDIVGLLPRFDSIYMPKLDEVSDRKIAAFREYASLKGAAINDRIKEVSLIKTEWQDVATAGGLEFSEEYRIMIRKLVNG